MKVFYVQKFLTGLKQECNIQEESVKKFYQETWKLLAVIVSHNNKMSVSVSKDVIDTLCECLSQADSAELKRTIILVIPSITKIIPTGKFCTQLVIPVVPNLKMSIGRSPNQKLDTAQTYLSYQIFQATKENLELK